MTSTTSFVPTAVVCARNNFFTLRVQEDAYLPFMHLQNLATNIDDAFASAAAICDAEGWVLKNNRDTLKQELEEIVRSSADERAAIQRRIEEEEQEAERRAAVYLAEKLAHYEKMRETHQVNFGKYAGVFILELPQQYIMYIVNSESEHAGMMILKDIIKTTYSGLILPTAVDFAVGEECTDSIQQIRIIFVSQWNHGFYGAYRIIKGLNHMNQLVVWFQKAGAPDVEVGGQYRMKFKIKEVRFDEYAKVNSMVINYVKLM